jgi:hypothetical protein
MILKKQLIEKGVEGSGFGPISDIIMDFGWTETRKNDPIMIVGIPAKMGTRHVQNKSQ